MDFPKIFICATRELGGFDHHIAAPYMRKSFTLENVPKKAELLISGLGFYEVFINGERITKGHLAPYISNSDDFVYFDKYEISEYLQAGKNAIGIILGNGMQNAFGGYIWDFEQAPFRSAPKAAFRIEAGDFELESDDSVKIADSPITFNELRCGEFYDANKEIQGWNLPDFDDSGWANALIAENPRGERRICEADLILPQKELKAVSITEQDGGFLYDFGENFTGVTRLRIKGEKGQTVSIVHGEWMHRGKMDVANFVKFFHEDYPQKTQYTCKGEGIEEHQPYFAYYGCQYALVHGITKEQATPELLTYVVMHSNLNERGSFKCSDEIINKLQDICRRSTLANFWYFPTDCPHREKNGWTGDAAVSCEHTLLNLQAEDSYREWLHNIRKAMNEQGQLPGIVPTGGWGYQWGNGPCWDQVLTTLPYFTYIYRGDKAILEENATAIFRYLVYLDENLNKQGLIDFGLGDWVQASRKADKHSAPIELTNSIVSMDICRMAGYIFKELGMERKVDFANALYNTLRSNLRKYKIDFGTMTAAGNCQTSQAMAMYYDVFEPGEKPAAMNVLLGMIESNEGKFDAGMLGLRVIFHLLSQFGHSDLAFDMIVRKDYPAYGYIVEQGFTTMVEEFRNDFTDFATSYNHHFLCDISGWFIKSILGIKVNPYLRSCNEVKLSPSFIEKLDWAEGHHEIPLGKIEVSWKRDGENILLSLQVPEGATGEISLPEGYVFANGLSYMKLTSEKDIFIEKRKPVNRREYANM